jgi:hypothetical protein
MGEGLGGLFVMEGIELGVYWEDGGRVGMFAIGRTLCTASYGRNYVLKRRSIGVSIKGKDRADDSP